MTSLTFWSSKPVRQSKILAVVFAVGLSFVLTSLLSRASAVTISPSSDWESGSFTDTEVTTRTDELQLQPTGSWGAQSWKTPDKSLGVGSAFASDGTYIYVFRGVADVTFWRYAAATNTWESLANSPRGTYYGAELTYQDGYIYAFFGGYQRGFGRYSIADNEWEMLESFPSYVYRGGSLASDGTYIYGAPGNASQEFYRYNVSTDTWSPLAPTPATLSIGADLVKVGDYLYTPRGTNTATFYRYDITAGTWSTMTNVPANMNDDIDTTTDGTNIFVARQTNTTNFYRYNVGANTWTTLTNAPYNSQSAGVQYLSSDGLIYFFRGLNDSRFWKYNIGSDSFIGPTEAPATLSTGSDMLNYDGTMYIPRGSNTTTFYGYTPSSNTWATLAVAPGTFNDDVKGVAAGAVLYFLRGSSTTTFYSYTPGTNTWATLAVAPGTAGYGATLAYPGSGDYIYATRGLNTATVWRYRISTNTWDTTPAALPTGVVGAYGSRMISDGTDIYFIAGFGVKQMYRYSIGLNTWTEVASPPFAPFYGTDMAYNDGKIVALAGWYKTELYEYSIADNAWRQLPSFASYGPTSIGAYTGAAIRYEPLSDVYYITVGGGRVELLAYTPGDDNFETTGTWVSEALDFQHVVTWASFDADETIPGDASVVYETQSSSDGSSWSGWSAVSGSTINSATARYLRVRATLTATTGSTQTPVVKTISITTTGDATPPANPTTVTGSSQQVGGDTLTSGNSYRHTHPYFSWNEAVDASSSIEGYYVYFGTDSGMNPAIDTTASVFQSGLGYQANTPFTTGTYYLRMATKDSAGNISAPFTAFVYDYIGISPSNSLTADDTAEFSGSDTNINTAGDEIQLDSTAAGFWQEARLTSSTTAIQWGGNNAVYIENSNKIYVLAAANNLLFRVYDVATDTWSSLADAPATVSFGGGLAEGPDGNLYAVRGNNFTEFWRYNIAENTWYTDTTSAPLTVSYGASLAYDGAQYIYLTRGNSTNTFWRYDTAANEWNSLDGVDFGSPADNFSNLVQRGGDLTIDRENGLVYATQGNYLKGFSVYDTNTGNWTVLPDTPTLSYDGSTIEYDPNSNTIFYTSGAATTYMYSYDVASQEWSQLSPAPVTMLYGAGMNIVGDDLYVLRGGATTSFYKYNITDDSWLLPTRGIFSPVYDGASLITLNAGANIVRGDPGNYYLVRGNYADDFIRWNEETGDITRMESLPVGVFTGSSMIYDTTAGKIYLTGGTYDRNMYAYTIATNTWARETNDPMPLAAGAGSSMAYDGSRYIYVNRGGSTTTIYRFDTQGSSGAKWSTMAVAPATLGAGAELLIKDGYIYTMRGLNVASNPFYRYDIAGNSWSTMAPLSVTVNTDGFLADGNDGYIYAARGVNTDGFYRYSIAGNTWSDAAIIPAQINVGAAGVSNLNNKIFALAGTGTNTYQDALYTYILQTADSGFLNTGEYISPSHDLTSVYKWANLTVNQTLLSNTGLDIETRSSPDSSDWSDWEAVSQQRVMGEAYNYKINSPADRYLQVRLTFTSSDGIATATLDDYTINYYSDAAAPTNPLDVGFSASSQQSGGVPIVTDTWYGHATPYFSWPAAEATNGATDTATGSGVAGYYVYFGQNASADPAVDGVYQTANTLAPTGITTSVSTYLRIKTIDNAGNISAATWQPFIYKYDAEAPPAPTDLAADPAGYSSIDSFDFSWTAASESGEPVQAYCYKTGASSGPYATEQCTNDPSIVSVTAVPSYQVGTNTFSVRSRDQSGNYSPLANVNYFYADASNAPAPPANLHMTTDQTSATNSFGFAWDVPAVFLGSAVNLSYRFSVNAIPTPSSTTTTSLRYLNPGAYATLPGENVFYVVAVDEAGNVNYSNYASISFFANTVAPGIPLDVEIADVSVKNTASWRLALSWDPPTATGSGVANYEVYRSTDGETFTKVSTTSSESYVDTRLEQVLYSYKIKACDNTSNCGEVSSVVALLPDGRYTSAPELVAEPTVSGITTRKAVVSWATNRESDSKIAYGTGSGSYFDEEVASSDPVSSHILTLNNLSPGTTYYVRARWTDEDGNTGEAEEISFATLPPPSTEEPVAKNVGLTSAQIEFVTRNAAKVRLYYGETSAFGGLKEIVTSTAESTQVIELDELLDATKYFYKINTLDVDGTEYEGEIHSFETLPRPAIDDVIIQQIQGTAKTTLLVRWVTNTPVSSVVTYYPSAAPQLAIDEVNVTLKAGNHQMILFNLTPQTPYTILIRGKDIAGNEAVSEPQQLLTSSDTRPPQITDLKVESEIIGTGEEATAQMIVSYKTDEPSTSQVEYGEGTGTVYSQKTQESGTLTDNHLVIISGLAPGKVYHLRSLSKDAAGNQAESIDKVVVSPKGTDDALDLVVNNLTSMFSFLRN